MTTIHARLTLYAGENMRKTPFHYGYRPVFYQQVGVGTSGHIQLLDRELLYPGESAMVNITLVTPSLVGELTPGRKLLFTESMRYPLGEIEVM